MKDKLEFKGYFWIPENPEEQITGLLNFSQKKGVELELFGQFEIFDNASSNDSIIILGITSDGKRLTLLNCYENANYFAIPGFRTSSISSIYLLLGEHFDSKDKICFKSMHIVYEDINHWLRISGFDRMQYDEDSKSTVIKYKKPENLTYDIDNNWQLDIDFSVWSPMANSKPFESAAINQIPEIILKPIQLRRFDEFQDCFETLNSFLSICYFTYPKIKSKEFYLDDNDGLNDKNIKVELFYKSGVKYSNYRKHDNRRRFLITYSDFNNEFQNVLVRWFYLKNKIGASINILTENFMNRNSSQEVRFLGFAQALENMHRRLTGDKKANLLKRLDSLVDNMPKEIKKELLLNEIDFSKRLTMNRNHFTHLDDKHEAKAASLSELFMLSEKMKIILITNLLKELNLSEALIKKIILENGMWLFNHIIKIKDFKTDD